MKALFVFLFLFVCNAVFAQTELVGKWKPVRFNIGNLITGDVKAGTIVIADSLDASLSNDKDPEESKGLMKMMAEIMLEKSSSWLQEFVPEGEYFETNTKRNKVTKGVFKFDSNTSTLETTIGETVTNYKVSFKDNHLVLVTLLGKDSGKKGELILELERVN